MEVVFDDGKLKTVRGPVSKGNEGNVSFLTSLNTLEEFVSFASGAAIFLHESYEFFIRKMSIFASSALEHMNSFLDGLAGKEAIKLGEGNSSVTVRNFMVEVVNLRLGHRFPSWITNS